MATPARILWYAPGGGLGHLSRSLAVLRHFRPLAKDAALLLVTSASQAHLAVEAGLPVLRLPGSSETAALGVDGLGAAAIRAIAPLDLLVVDTFADGFEGELTPEVLALARRKALIYREGGVVPAASSSWDFYDTILAPYPVSPHPDAEAVGTIVARHPDEALAVPDARRRLGLPNDPAGPLILAMHAGDPGEVAGFFQQVRAATRHLGRPHELRLVTPLPLPGDPSPDVAHLFPVSEVLPAANLVIAGAGYNTVAELTLFGVRALYRPFDRSHDVPIGRLGGEETVFAALTAPVELAALMRAKLDGHAPRRADRRDFDGARNAARAIAALLPHGST